jgi:hypothetical protein
MKKTSLSRALFVGAAVAMAGAAAQADAIFYPDGTVVELGDNDVVALDATPTVDTTVLGAAPAGSATVTTTTSTAPALVYVQPNIHWDRATVVSQMHQRKAMVGDRHASAATFDVPSRAGEASTMTGGAPNMVTSNDRVVVGSHTVPYGVVTVHDPYYVMSF